MGQQQSRWINVNAKMTRELQRSNGLRYDAVSMYTTERRIAELERIWNGAS
jgi:hypothetical protein